MEPDHFALGAGCMFGVTSKNISPLLRSMRCLAIARPRLVPWVPFFLAGVLSSFFYPDKDIPWPIPSSFVFFLVFKEEVKGSVTNLRKLDSFHDNRWYVGWYGEDGGRSKKHKYSFKWSFIDMIFLGAHPLLIHCPPNRNHKDLNWCIFIVTYSISQRIPSPPSWCCISFNVIPLHRMATWYYTVQEVCSSR